MENMNFGSSKSNEAILNTIHSLETPLTPKILGWKLLGLKYVFIGI
jgi:hypothetical protein